MTFVIPQTDPKAIRAEIKELKKAGDKIRRSQKSARAFLLKHGLIARGNPKGTPLAARCH